MSNYEQQVQKLKSNLETARQHTRLEKQHLKDAKQKLSCSLEAQQLLQVLAQGVQQKAHLCIAEIVTRCLEAVFDEPYEFKIMFDRKRGKTEARLVFLRDDHEINPLEGAGGGVVDIAAFAARLASLVLSRPKRRAVLILDEPFRFVSAEYRPRVRMLLEQLARDMNMQFILVTHIEDLQVGKVVKL